MNINIHTYGQNSSSRYLLSFPRKKASTTENINNPKLLCGVD